MDIQNLSISGLAINWYLIIFDLGYDSRLDLSLNMAWEESTRRTVLHGTESLVRTADSLERSQRAALDAEQIGYAVVGDLNVQRESLERSRQTLIDSHQQLQESHKVLSSMQRRVFYNKFVLIAIIVTEALILALVVYLKHFK